MKRGGGVFCFGGLGVYEARMWLSLTRGDQNYRPRLSNLENPVERAIEYIGKLFK
jgi:hypothetical protein